VSSSKAKKSKEPTPKEQARFEKRKAVVAAVQRGDRPTDVARIYDVAVRSVFDWLAWYRQGGWHALREGSRTGRPRKVDGKVMKWLYTVITRDDPTQYHFEFCLWTLGIIRQLLQREHGIVLSKSAVSRLLGQLGLSPQRPLYRSYKRQPKELRKFLDETYPGLRAKARRTGALIFFVDEAAVRSDAHYGTTWGKIGQTPVVEDTGDRFGVRLISAVSPRGDMKFASFEGKMTGERFIEFVEKLRRDAGRPLIIIADNASYHRGKHVRTYVADREGDVVVENLPRYSPELNPDEQVWNHAKRRLGQLFIATREEMKTSVHRILRSIQQSTELVLSFFQLPDTSYAAVV
jgi:transposase